MRKIKVNLTQDEYQLKFDWPKDCYIQCGKKGIVISRDGNHYKTAFLEAFPLETFIRGEGADLEYAEEKAWLKYQKYLNCENHDFERKNEAGSGECKKCGYRKTDALKNLRICACCNKKDVYFNEENNTFCFEHYLENYEKNLRLEKEKLDGKSDIDIFDMISQEDIDFIYFIDSIFVKVLNFIKEKLLKENDKEIHNKTDIIYDSLNKFITEIFTRVLDKNNIKPNFGYRIILDDYFLSNSLISHIIEVNFISALYKKKYEEHIEKIVNEKNFNDNIINMYEKLNIE